MKHNMQAPVRTDRAADGSLAVHSYFHTIQGEGPYAGESAYFIRLYGCNLQCPGCDTDYTSHSSRTSVADLVALVATQRPIVGDMDTDLVVITGGEPFRQNLTPLVERLVLRGYRVQVETNGTLFLKDFPYQHEQVTVVCSPKTQYIHPELAPLVDAYKYVLRAGDVAEDGLPTVALMYERGVGMRVFRPPVDWHGPIFVQPMDEQDDLKNRANARAVAHTVMTHRRYIMGWQMHKYLELP